MLYAILFYFIEVISDIVGVWTLILHFVRIDIQYTAYYKRATFTSLGCYTLLRGPYFCPPFDKLFT